MKHIIRLVLPIFTCGVLAVTLLIADWFQVFGAKIYTTLPSEIETITVQGELDLEGIIYFDATQFGTDGRKSDLADLPSSL